MIFNIRSSLDAVRLYDSSHLDHEYPFKEHDEIIIRMLTNDPAAERLAAMCVGLRRLADPKAWYANNETAGVVCPVSDYPEGPPAEWRGTTNKIVKIEWVV